MKLHVVVNPAGASGRTGKEWENIKPLFLERCELTVHYSTREKGIGEICGEIERTAEGEKVNILIVGGDGSLNDAVNGIKDLDLVNFALLPCGSGNDFARDMDWPKDLKDLAEMILKGEVVRRLDVGELTYLDTGETRRFNVSAGIGFDAAICELAGRSRFKTILNKVHLGKLIYIVSAFQVVGSQKALPVEIITDGEAHRYEYLFLACAMNHRFEGGGYQFTPDADATDGVLDLCIADPKHNSAFYTAFPYVPSGKHFEKFDFLHELHGRKIEIKASIPLYVHTDGEVRRKAERIGIRVLEKKMNMLA